MDNSKSIQLVPLELTDAYDLNTLINENLEYFGKYLPITVAHNLNVKASEAYIQKKKKENNKKTTLTYGIKETATGKLIGLIILKNIFPKLKQGEFAYCLGEAYGGKGLMSEAVHTFIDHAHLKLGIENFKIITHNTNIASCKVAEKNGFIWKKTLIKEFRPPNFAPMDMELYELTL
jgi:ribosomal-protein-alanine N-acetyltransferase